MACSGTVRRFAGRGGEGYNRPRCPSDPHAAATGASRADGGREAGRFAAAFHDISRRVQHVGAFCFFTIAIIN
jgi:hypothetical protein